MTQTTEHDAATKLVAAVLYNPADYQAVSWVVPDHFPDPHLAAVWDALRPVMERGSMDPIVEVLEALNGAHPIVLDAFNRAASGVGPLGPGTASFYAERLAQSARRRALLKAAHQAVRLVEHADGDQLDDLLRSHWDEALEGERPKVATGVVGLSEFLASTDSESFDWVIPGLLEHQERLILVAPPKSGKALDVDTPIQTRDGWRTMESIKPGDVVRGLDRSWTEVVAATEVMEGHDCYAVQTTHGDLVADAGHLWTVQVGRDQMVLDTLDIREVVGAGMTVHLPWVDRFRKDRVLAVDPVPSRPVRCIQVDVFRGNFLAGRDLVPTHNSVLSRQVGICVAAGRHPFDPRMEVPRQRVLMIDLENPRGVLRRDLRRQVAGVDGSDGLWLLHQPAGVDLGSMRDLRLIEQAIRDLRPDLVVMGPLYKAYEGLDQSWEQQAAGVQRPLDRWRSRYGCAFWIEHHSSKAEPTGLFGSSRWSRWFDAKVALVPEDPASPPPYQRLEWQATYRDSRRIRPELLEVAQVVGLGDVSWLPRFPFGEPFSVQMGIALEE